MPSKENALFSRSVSCASVKHEGEKLLEIDDFPMTQQVLCADAGKAGVGKDAASATRMSLDEAQKILGISREAPLEEVLKVSPGTYADCPFCDSSVE